MEKKVTRVKVKRVPDGALHAASRDIRTVLRWLTSVTAGRSIKTEVARMSNGMMNEKYELFFEIEVETKDGECSIRGKTIASVFREFARLIREKEIDDCCFGYSNSVIEGRDF